jgi:hypothetical protein
MDGVLQDVFRPKRLFNLAEANRTLPLVSRIMDDIVRTTLERDQTSERSRALLLEGKSREAEAEEDRAQSLDHQKEAFIEELQAIGCLCKDPVRGLVDFPSRFEDRIVFLCWQRGEPEIRFYHELDGGFVGRKPVL